MKVFIFDFDDTIADSTPKIHYPAYKKFCEMIKIKPLTLEQYYREMFYHTYSEFIENMHLTKEQYDLEFSNWKQYTAKIKPKPFKGILSLLKKIQKNGHKLVICSQSNLEAIENFFNSVDIKPDLIIAGDRKHPERNKPYNYPIELIKKKYKVETSQMMVIDDMKPGLLMAKNNKIKSVGVMYSGFHESLKNEIAKLSSVVVNSVEELIAVVNEFY